MKTYIFYTTDGFTEDGHGREVENCQVLDWAKGDDANEAFENFKKENEHLRDSGFHDVMCQEIVSMRTHYFSTEW